jgi:hypothetical protein
MKKYLLLLLLVLSLGRTAHAAPTLTLSSATALPDSDITVYLSVANAAAAYGGFNARLVYPSCMSMMSVAAGSFLPSSFVIDHTVTEGGGLKNLSVVAYSGTEAFSANGKLLAVNFHVGSDCTVGPKTVSFATVDADPLVNNKHAISNQDGSASLSHVVSNGSVVVMSAETDTDNDGMDDAWERFYFGDLNRNGAGDSDKDGYSDLQEYLNFKDGELDPSGHAFDPITVNEPNGTGYKQPSSSKFWILMMPAIQNAAKPVK